MKRTKLKDRVLPTYSKGEEIFNMVTHIVGGGMGIITLIAGTLLQYCIIVDMRYSQFFYLQHQ